MDEESLSNDTFQLIFDGDGIENGEMDVFALAPAILAVGELFRDADASLNGSSTLVRTAVKAGFQEGSFEVLFAIDQQLRDAAVGLLPSLHLIGADKLISAVIGNALEKARDTVVEKAPEIVSGLFNLLGKLKGEKPKEIRQDDVTNTSIFVVGSGNSIIVDRSTAQLYESRQVRSAASRVASPLNSASISVLKAKRNTDEIASLTRTDFPELEDQLSQLEASQRLLSAGQGGPPPQELTVRIMKANFAEGKWSVSDGGRSFQVFMDDDDFKTKVHAREIGFYDGDMYRVRMVTTQKLEKKRLITTRSIVKVLEPMNEMIQEYLPLPQSRRIKKRKSAR